MEAKSGHSRCKKPVTMRVRDMLGKCKTIPHVETVVLLSQRKADDYVEVELELDELDVTSAESKATYAEIKKRGQHI